MATVRDRQTLTPSTIELKAFLAESWRIGITPHCVQSYMEGAL